jgi:5'-nucleotidase
MHARSVLALALTATLVLAACGDDDSGGEEAADDGTTTTTSTEPLQIVVTNDDGVEGEGIDVLAQELQALPDVEVTVVAPAGDETGTGDQSTEGDVQYTESELISGFPATAVDGFPADSVNVAIQELGLDPDVVVSGSNAGQNIGPLIELSGTVGAAATAARQGVPAVAISQGLGEPIDYPSGVEAAVTWVEDHRDDYLTGEADLLHQHAHLCNR